MDLKSPETLGSISNTIVRPSVTRPLKKLYQGEPMALGITQIFIGILEIAFGILIVVIEDFYAPLGSGHIMYPYWAGVLYIISGSLSVAAAKNSKIPLVKGMLGMNIVSAVAAGIAIVILSFAVAHQFWRVWHCNYYNDRSGYCNQSLVDSLTNITAVLLAMTVLEFLITIVTASFGCASLCRNTYSETTMVIFQNTGQGAPPAVLMPVKEEEAP